jgi:hypothetical protein
MRRAIQPSPQPLSRKESGFLDGLSDRQPALERVKPMPFQNHARPLAEQHLHNRDESDSPTYGFGLTK